MYLKSVNIFQLTFNSEESQLGVGKHLKFGPEMRFEAYQWISIICSIFSVALSVHHCQR